MIDLAQRVVTANAASGRMIALAESCTGGLVAAALTEIPGSSAVLESGYVTYSNDAKIRMLGVNQDIIETFGAVSVAVAWAMAQGALKKSGADIAVAISGVAGPGGGTEHKTRWYGCVRSRRKRSGSRRCHSRPQGFRVGQNPRRNPHFCGASRARTAASIKRMSAGDKGRSHLAQSGIEELAGKRLEHAVAEREIDGKIDCRTAA